MLLLPGFLFLTFGPHGVAPLQCPPPRLHGNRSVFFAPGSGGGVNHTSPAPVPGEGGGMGAVADPGAEMIRAIGLLAGLRGAQGVDVEGLVEGEVSIPIPLSLRELALELAGETKRQENLTEQTGKEVRNSEGGRTVEGRRGYAL